MSKIAFISCAKKKRVRGKWPACELYISPLFQKSYKYAKEVLKADQIYILSKKYLVVRDNELLESYDECLGDRDVTREDRLNWAKEVFSKMQQNESINLDKDELHFLAGELYLENLLPIIKETYPNARINKVLKGRIGDRLHFLEENLAKLR